MSQLFTLCILFTVSSADTTGQKLLEDATNYCSSVTLPESLSSIQSKMQDQLVGRTNYIEEAIYDTTCGSVSSCFQKYGTEIGWKIAQAGAPILGALLTLLAWIVLGSCACCRCCRRCCSERYPKQVTRAMKLSLLVLVSSFLAGVVIVVIFAALAAMTFNAGNSAMVCEVYTISSDTINGLNWTTDGVDYTFLGTDELSLTLAELTNVLDPDSPQMRAVSNTVDNTVSIDNSLNRFNAYLDLTQATLGQATVMKVGAYYQCAVCVACCGGENSLVKQLQQVVADSLSSQVDATRSTIQSTLTGSGSENTFEAVNSTNNVIADLSQRMDEELGQNLIDHKSTVDLVLKWAFIIVIVLIALVSLPLIFLVLSIFFGLKKWDNRNLNNEASKPHNPCLVSCGWCTALGYAFVMLLLGGVFLLLGFFEASVCTMASDTDTFFENITFRLQTDDSVVGAEELVDACFKTTGNGDLLSTITVSDGTARSALEEVYSIENDFNEVFSTPPQPSDSIANNPLFQQLIDSMTAYGAIYMISAPDIVALRQTASFASLATDVIQTGLGGNAICSQNQNIDLTATSVGDLISASLQAASVTVGNPASATIESDVDYNDAVVSNYGVITSGTCPYTVTSQVQPYANMYAWKNSVQAKNNFPCYTITETTNPSTGIITFSRNLITCTSQAAFNTYISSYLSASLLSAAQQLDAATLATYNQIQASIEDLIQNQILPPVNLILNGTDCLFLGDSWLRIYNAVCYLETPGGIDLAYTFTAFGALSWIAVIVMFVIWRRLKDSLSLWTDLNKKQPRRNSIHDEVAKQVKPA